MVFVSSHPMFGKRWAFFVGYKHCIFLLSVFLACNASTNHICPASSCGNINNISYPFRLEIDPKECGDGSYTLSCENNTTVLYLDSEKYYVQAITYNNFTIRVVDAGVREDDCSSAPLYTLSYGGIVSHRLPYSFYEYRQTGPKSDLKWPLPSINQIVTFVRCANPVSNSSLYVDTRTCFNEWPSNHGKKSYVYAIVGGLLARDVGDLCSIEMVVMGAAWLPAHGHKDYKNMSYKEIHRALAYGFELSWYNSQCDKACRGDCYLNVVDNVSVCLRAEVTILGYIFEIVTLFGHLDFVLYLILGHLAANFVVGIPLVIGFLAYKWRRRHLSAFDGIEEFLLSHNNLMPVRYSYSDIKKITKNFQDKLGEGGFGTVYKGKLRSGSLAAIKVLGKSKAIDGQEFISEIATIGRIHHVNVVKLIGFCAESSKYVLVYEFMPNGSLDKYIFSREGSIPLSWEKLLEISLGVARGIEYLHRGCDVQILHFDIKPHNILLDKNFTPKVADFGLARCYPINNSIASLTAARGTIGYMAPELFYKNSGHVSQKADVYGFGMLLLEMAGKRKNLNPFAESSSEIYFPFWVHDQVSSDSKVVEIEDASEEEMMIARKMIIVGLWCIQMKPATRPPMNNVVEMLEGDLQDLILPPRPVLYPEETSTKVEQQSDSDMTESTTESMSSHRNASDSNDPAEAIRYSS